MSYSYTLSQTTTFTITHARYIGAKVTADLMRLQRFYDEPSDNEIADFETEIIELLKGGYLETVTYGFRRDGQLIEPTLRYTATELAGMSANDDDPGRIRPGADVSSASFYSYLTYTLDWYKLSPDDRNKLKSKIPFERGNAPEPILSGYYTQDLTYSSGGRALNRHILRSFS
jgi:Bacterial HORMA domain family 1